MRYTPEFQRLLEYAAYDCANGGQTEVDVDHLMLGLYREDFPLVDEVFATFRVDSMVVLDRLLARLPRRRPAPRDAVGLGPDAQRAIGEAEREAERLGHRMLTPAHTLIGILSHERNRLHRYFIRREIVQRREDEVLMRVRELVGWLRFAGGKSRDRDVEVLDGDAVVRTEAIRLRAEKARRGRGYAVQIRFLKLFS